jgi:predicted DNA-binding transcriptional regulator AlpA
MAEHLMATAEIRARLGLSRQRVYQLTQRPDWPVPYDVLVVGKVWRREDVEAWIIRHRPTVTGLAEGEQVRSLNE